ncbi:MAG TPA: hypothetical protein VFI73_04305 [Candidatus Nitrosopolaris sp.]|nr:hypothetical protein [Candidatus Nitrosopolaris sp.]
MGLAKSSNSAKLVLPFFLTENGNYTYPFLGLTAATVLPTWREVLVG